MPWCTTRTHARQLELASVLHTAAIFCARDVLCVEYCVCGVWVELCETLVLATVDDCEDDDGDVAAAAAAASAVVAVEMQCEHVRFC